MKTNEYLVLSEAVEDGIVSGWGRAHKHTDRPSEEVIKDAIHNAVMASISEYFGLTRCVMTTKTLKDAIEAKLRLQQDILGLIREFEKGYGLGVTNIRIDSDKRIGENRCFAWRVEVLVEV